MNRTAAYAPFVAAAMCWVCGCALTGNDNTDNPYGAGPAIALPAIADATEPSVVAVKFVDQRPQWERVYYPGSLLLHRHQWAISFVPMENFDPSFHRNLTAEIRRRAESLADAPSSVAVRLTSFRLVVDQTEKQKALYEKQQELKQREREQQEKEEREREARKKRERKQQKWKHKHKGHHHGDDKHCEDDDDLSFGAKLLVALAEPFAEAIVTGLTDGIGESVDQSVEEACHRESHLKQPPKVIHGEYLPGITCVVEASVRMDWADGRSVDMPLRATSHVFPRADGDRPSDISAVVNHGIRRLGIQLSQQARDHFVKPIAFKP